MRSNHIREKWARGETVVNGWLSIASSYSAEIVAAQGYDSVTVDMQHGMVSFADAITLLQAISTTGAVPLARVPSSDPALSMQVLDAGAYGVICPMVDDAAECERFVRACRYPPQGERSFAGGRSYLYGGSDYFEHANTTVLTLAMIETRRGLENIDEILSVPGLDAVFIGPNDLALAVGAAPASESDDPRVVAAIEQILASASDHRLKTAIFCSSGVAARARAEQGFDLVTPGDDSGMLAAAAASAVSASRGG